MTNVTISSFRAIVQILKEPIPRKRTMFPSQPRPLLMFIVRRHHGCTIELVSGKARKIQQCHFTIRQNENRAGNSTSVRAFGAACPSNHTRQTFLFVNPNFASTLVFRMSHMHSNGDAILVVMGRQHLILWRTRKALVSPIGKGIVMQHSVQEVDSFGIQGLQS